MIETVVMTEDDYKSFIRPAVYDSLKAVLNFYGLDGTNQIIYNGENEISKLIGSNSSDNQRTNVYTDGTFNDKLYIVPEFTPIGFNNGYSNQRREKTERPIWFNDQDFDSMGIYPGFNGMQVSVSIVGMFNSLKLAEQFINRINIAQQNQMVDMNFSTTVHLGLTVPMIDLLENIHTLLAKSNKDTPLFGDWFDKFATAPITTIMNERANHKRLAVPMRLVQIGIQFAEPVIQRARKGATYGRYEVEARYSFYFKNFTHWSLVYPMTVYQDQIDSKWIPRPQKSFVQPLSIRSNYESAFGSSLSPERSMEVPYFLKTPDYDCWVKPAGRWIQNVVQARLRLKDLPEQKLCNIFEIPGFVWKEEVKRYILRRHLSAFKHHYTPFLVQVFSGDIAVLPEQLRMDPDGTVWITRTPNLKNIHHICITLDYAIRDYTDEFWNDLIDHPEDWQIIPGIFDWYDWGKLPYPWVHHIDDVRRDIDQGTGLPFPPFNNYQMELGLVAHNYLVQDKRPRPED